MVRLSLQIRQYYGIRLTPEQSFRVWTAGGEDVHRALIFAWTLAILVVCFATPSFACDDDSDCKGDRVCNKNGKCVNPEEDVFKPTPRTVNPAFVPQQQRIASVCQTNYGRCAMSVPIPIGSSCYCPTQVGPIAGVAM